MLSMQKALKAKHMYTVFPHHMPDVFSPKSPRHLFPGSLLQLKLTNLPEIQYLIQVFDSDRNITHPKFDPTGFEPMTSR